MPVTPTQTRGLRDRFGDVAADEIVDVLNNVEAASVTELRTLNELNISRFAAMDRRYEAFEAKMDRRFDALEAKMDRRFEIVEARFDAYDATLDARLKLGFAEQDARNF